MRVSPQIEKKILSTFYFASSSKNIIFAELSAYQVPIYVPEKKMFYFIDNSWFSADYANNSKRTGIFPLYK
jgi:hypothetical protein